MIDIALDWVSELRKHFLGCGQTRIRIRDRKRCRQRKRGAEVRLRKAVRPSIKSPCIRPTLDGYKDDADAYQPEQRNEPPCVINVGESEAIKQGQSLRSVRTLNLF